MSFDSEGASPWPLPQTKGLMCCYLLWLGEVRQSACFLSPSFAFTPSPLSVYKRCLRIFSHRSASLSVCCFFFFASFILLFFSAIFPPLLFFFGSLRGKVRSPSLLSLPPLPTQYPISFPPPCHLCTTFIMTDWWLLLHHLSVMMKSPRLVLTNLQLVCLHTDCKLCHS